MSCHLETHADTIQFNVAVVASKAFSSSEQCVLATVGELMVDAEEPQPEAAAAAAASDIRTALEQVRSGALPGRLACSIAVDPDELEVD